MIMKPTPTVEEFLNTFNKEKGNTDKLYYDSYIISFAKEFAKLHVEEASEKAKIIDDPNSYCGNTGSEYPSDQIVSTKSILNSYPLTNIK